MDNHNIRRSPYPPATNSHTRSVLILTASMRSETEVILAASFLSLALVSTTCL